MGGGVAPPAELARVCVARALEVAGWVIEEVLHDDVRREGEEEYRTLQGKVSGELGMLLHVVRLAGLGSALGPGPAELAHGIAPHARAPFLRDRVLRRPSRVVIYGLPHLCLQRLGVPDDAFDRVVRLALAGSASGALERVPYRLADGFWVRHLAFGDRELERGWEALRHGVLVHGVDLLYPEAADAYTLLNTGALSALTYGRPAGVAPPSGFGAALQAGWPYLPASAAAHLSPALDFHHGVWRGLEEQDLVGLRTLLTEGTHFVERPLFVQAVEYLQRALAGAADRYL